MKQPRYYRITDYDRALLPNSLLARLDDGCNTSAAWTQKTGLSPGHPSWGLLYHIALATLSPSEFNLIVETGTNWGLSTIVLAQALKDSKRPGRCVTVELDPVNRQKAISHFNDAGVSEFIDSFEGDSVAQLPKMISGHDKIRIAYLDGCHDMEHVLKEFEIVHKKMACDGLVLLDNTMLIADEGEDQRVFGAIEKIRKTFGGQVVNMPFTSWYTPGLAIWQMDPFPHTD